MFQCLNQDQIERFKAGRLDQDELKIFMLHVAECEACSALLAESYETAELVSPPSGIEEEILRKLNRNPRKEFWQYSIRVSVAVCASLFILFTGMFQNFNSNLDKTAHKINQFRVVLENVIQNHIDMEGLSNDKEE